MNINGSDRWRTAVAVVGFAAVGVLAGCGDDSSGTTDAADATPEPSASASAMSDNMDSDGMDGMDGMMNDPSATPADQIDGAVEATFALLDTRPPGTDDAAGTAWLAQTDDGTTVTVTMTGLEPGAQYMGHLHAQECAADNGGPHFKFDESGPETPPNEVHLGFTAAADGTGTATVTNEQQVGDAAKSVVIHPMETMDNRLACADF
ncbi:hypothetical protein O7621_21825 [Solwaraspora sp. WMMD937]|uniref:hypothetical protein n=1 Tax=Solwaraspora sp. WMMD937 TaxID=3016090 RepID=UPI00249B5CB7|nr:hypothetical protein [Solwaraspora sp. WMMD937]WFE20514.1 hypothetical protein O7621_21825 [Solwaraspora sp. WMMD937]